MGKTFDRPKLDEDMEVGIRGLYQDHGYFKVERGRQESRKRWTMNHERNSAADAGHRRQARKSDEHHHSIEKARNTAWASSRFRSADPDQGLIFKPEFLPRVFPLKEGDIFDADKIRKSLDDYPETLRRVRLHRFHGRADLRRGRRKESRQLDAW